MTEPKTDAELLKLYDDTWNDNEVDIDTPVPDLERICLRAVYEAGRADGPADAPAWRDRQGDVWTLGTDGLMHSPETAPFAREHVEKKWGPLVPIEVGPCHHDPLPYVHRANDERSATRFNGWVELAPRAEYCQDRTHYEKAPDGAVQL